MTSSLDWQTALDPPLLQRLYRPLRQPGKIDGTMAKQLIERHRQMVPSSPLWQRLLQRQGQSQGFPNSAIPIVYAQLASPTVSPADSRPMSSPTATAERSGNVVSAPIPAASPTIIQAKFDPAATGSTSSDAAMTPSITQPPMREGDQSSTAGLPVNLSVIAESAVAPLYQTPMVPSTDASAFPSLPLVDESSQPAMPNAESSRAWPPLPVSLTTASQAATPERASPAGTSSEVPSPWLSITTSAADQSTEQFVPLPLAAPTPSLMATDLPAPTSQALSATKGLSIPTPPTANDLSVSTAASSQPAVADLSEPNSPSQPPLITITAVTTASPLPPVLHIADTSYMSSTHPVATSSTGRDLQPTTGLPSHSASPRAGQAPSTVPRVRLAPLLPRPEKAAESVMSPVPTVQEESWARSLLSVFPLDNSPSNPPFQLPLPKATNRDRSTPPASEMVAPRATAKPVATPIVQGHPAAASPLPPASPPTSAPPTVESIDINRLVDKVERRLKRQLIIERERRGWTS